MLPYTIDDSINDRWTWIAEVTINFGSEKRWLFIITTEHLASVGDWVDGTQVRLHLGERHMIIVSELSEEIIDAVLRQLYIAGELESRTLPLE